MKGLQHGIVALGEDVVAQAALDHFVPCHEAAVKPSLLFEELVEFSSDGLVDNLGEDFAKFHLVPRFFLKVAFLGHSSEGKPQQIHIEVLIDKACDKAF